MALADEPNRRRVREHVDASLPRSFWNNTRLLQRLYDDLIHHQLTHCREYPGILFVTQNTFDEFTEYWFRTLRIDREPISIVRGALMIMGVNVRVG